MSPSPSLTDDEALWFPVHTSAGDSFSRGAGPDGGAPSGDDDSIGLPGRPPRNGQGTGKGPPKKGGIKASSWLWLTLWGAAAIGVVAYAARKEIAAEVVQSWLKGQGANAHVKFDALSLSHTTGTIYVGDEAHPELRIDSFDVDYSLNFFGGGQPLARIKSLHLVKPVVQFSYLNGKLNFGSLDKVVQNALTAKPNPKQVNGPPPEDIAIDGADVQLTSDYGIVHGRGDVKLHNGLLKYLTLSVPKTHLRGPMGEGDLNAATVTAQSVAAPNNGDQLHVVAKVDADSWDVKGSSPTEVAEPTEPLHLKGVAVSIDSLLPYRDSKSIAEAFSGAMSGTFAFRADKAVMPSSSFTGLEANLNLDGQIKSSLTGGSFTGTSRLLARADAIQTGDLDSRDVQLKGDKLAVTAGLEGALTTLNLQGPVTGDIGAFKQGDLAFNHAHVNLSDLHLTSGADGAAATFNGGISLQHAGMTDLSLDGVTVALAGSGQSDASGAWGLTLHSDVASDHGSYSALKPMVAARVQARADLLKKPAPGAPTAPQEDVIVVLDRAFERFSLRMRGLDIALNGSTDGVRSDIRLKNGAQLALNGGGTAVLTSVAGKPFLSSGQAGAFGIALNGGDLPQIDATVDGFAADPRSGALAGNFHASAALTFDPVRDIHVDGSGRFTLLNGNFDVVLKDGATFTAGSAELGDHVTDLSASLSQTGSVFFHYTPTAWAAHGTFKDLALNAPNEVVHLAGGTGTFDAFTIAGSDAVGLKAHLVASSLSDTSPAGATRFNPLIIYGDLNQDAKTMAGRFTAATPSVKDAKGQPFAIAAINLDNDNATGAGSLSFRTLDLKFAPSGVQPSYLSPLVTVLMSKDVSGGLDFTGAFNWTKDTASSGGLLKLNGLNFTGATGVSQGLKGEIAFNSLAPLTSEPGQMISIDSMQIGVPLNDLNLSVQFLADRIALEKAVVESPGGPVILEPMAIPLDGKSDITGALSFNGLDFGKIIAATSLATSMTFKGDMSGRLPFTVSGGHITFVDGHMQSDAPGQISVKRTAVTAPGIATGTVTTDAPPATAAVAAANAKAAATSDPNFNPFQDLAFQAMEYVTYEQIDAKLNSQKGGILDVNFHIKGYFDPPQKQKATISLFDYVSGAWMKKPIKLPSKTPVELYLDIPVNLDEILNDLAQFSANTATKPQ